MRKYRIETKSGSFLGIIEGKRAFNKWFEDRQKYNTYTKKEDCILVPVKESKKACHVIYDSYDVYNEEDRQNEKENFMASGWAEEEITDDMITDALYDSNRAWFEDEFSLLAKHSEGGNLDLHVHRKTISWIRFTGVKQPQRTLHAIPGKPG